jgi:hypothetical protein
MAKLRARIIDRNRFSKRYPFIKGPKRLTYLGDDDLAIELGTIVFDNESSKKFNFEAPFKDTNYIVVATPRDTASASDGSAQVSLSVNSDGIDKSFVTIIASARFTGEADVIAIRVG